MEFTTNSPLRVGRYLRGNSPDDGPLIKRGKLSEEPHYFICLNYHPDRNLIGWLATNIASQTKNICTQKREDKGAQRTCNRLPAQTVMIIQKPEA